MSRWNTRVIVALSLALVVTLPACGRDQNDGDKLRAALALSKREASTFVYSDDRPAEKVRVAGVLEDDFRYKALVSLGEKPAYEEVVSDDAVALRFLDPQRLTRLVDVARADNADRTTELEGVDVAAVLQSGRWLVDPGGAPPVAAAFAAAEDLGKDPVFDAITVLDYVEQAVNQAASIDEFNEDSLDPTYRKSEDTFPKPEKGSNVTRYDLRRPRLPSAADLSGQSGGAGLPGTRHFRKMAIYVKDGRIIRVLERIEVRGDKAFEELSEYFDSLLRESRASKAVIDRARRDFQTAARSPGGSALVLRGVSTIVEALGEDPILVRNMSIEYDTKSKGAEVAVPSDNTVKGSMDAFVISRASKIADPNATGSSDQGGGGGQPPSTPPPGEAPAPDQGGGQAPEPSATAPPG